MKQWIGLIVVVMGAYYLWVQYGDKLGGGEPDPATPEVAWYLENIEHNFAIVPERGHAWFFRGFHQNKTTTTVVNVRVKVFMRNGEDWAVLDTFNLGVLEPEGRQTFDKAIRVPAEVAKPKLRWEVVDVRKR